MQMDIYIREKNGNREIRIPLLPETIPFPRGDTTFIETDIMGLGVVAIPSGTELAPYSWESEFPGELRKNDPMMHGTWKPPETYCNILDEWKQKGTLLTLLIIGYPVNTDVYCKEFKPEGAGPFGDICYGVAFIEARDIKITTDKSAAKSAPKRPVKTAKTYTIKSGDTLWAIAQRVYSAGSKWQTLYNANKAIIEKTAKAHGRQSSQNGHWIYPGTVITTP